MKKGNHREGKIWIIQTLDLFMNGNQLFNMENALKRRNVCQQITRIPLYYLFICCKNEYFPFSDLLIHSTFHEIYNLPA